MAEYSRQNLAEYYSWQNIIAGRIWQNTVKYGNAISIKEELLVFVAAINPITVECAG